MNISSFADGIAALDTKKYSVVWLRGKEYGPLSIKALRTVLSKQSAIRTISTEDGMLTNLQTQSSVSFLGDTYFYYIGDISKHLKQKNSSWYTYLSSYAGPHTLIFWAEESLIPSPPASWLIIAIPESIDARLAKDIVDILYPDQKQNVISLLNMLWPLVPSLSFEELCKFSMYATIIGTQSEHFIKEYVPTLICRDNSLFTLSQYLLSKQKDAFYREWSLMIKQYPMIFWISFWSDQLWRATLFVRSMHANKRAEAHEIAKYRLPFSFTKTDWAYTNPDIVQQHYSYLCDVDFIAKNGGSDMWIELFFLRWFAPYS